MSDLINAEGVGAARDMEEAEKRRREVNLADAQLRMGLIDLEKARVAMDKAQARVLDAIESLRRARR